MSTVAAPNGRAPNSYDGREGLDVDWLLRKRDFPQSSKDNNHSKQDAAASPTTPKTSNTPSAKPSAVETTRQPSTPKSPSAVESPVNATAPRPAAQTPPRPHINTAQRQNSASVEESKANSRSPIGTLKQSGRRSSWISSLGHKLSGSSNNPSRNGSVDSQKAKSPLNSPAATEFANPFDKKGGIKAEEKNDASANADPPVIVPQSPRRPSVLVAAGTETRIESPGFLSSALRRLSSSNNVTLGKGAGQGAICPRKVMNVDQYRERVKIADLDQSKLRRVAFCVDVEIAGVSSQADEDSAPSTDAPAASSPAQASTADRTPSKDVKSAVYKDQSEGAALKNPQTAAQQKEQTGQTKADQAAEAKAKNYEDETPAETAVTNIDGGAPPTTRKKEKKKRSEAERKERREKRRKHAEANGLVPLEFTRDDDSSDSSPSNTPAGTSTPRKHTDQPTTDPLRIYKRCCQLRETTALSIIKEQITKPAATLAEAPGTVGVIDLSGTSLSLQDVTTFGDWLAVVPVRKLVLDNCNLSDEALRVILSGLTGCKTSEQARHNRKLSRHGHGKQGQEQLGVIERISLKNNTTITSLGWKHIALFIHLCRSLIAIDLEGIPFPSPNSVKNNSDVGALFVRAIAERTGTRLVELIASGCGLSSTNISGLVDAAIRCKIKRLGLAGNRINAEGLQHVVRYITSGVCEGLDLGSNNLHDTVHVLASSIDENNPLFAISLADCALTADDLKTILPRFTLLKNFKFLDLSRNSQLFSRDAKDATPVLRKVLPRMQVLRRLHLANVGLTPDHVIALSEILPDCTLAHINILENDALIKAMNSMSPDLQEEAAAFLASLMTAVRVSSTIVAIEIEVPSAETSEVVRALASQVVAYSLRNMERSAMDAFDLDAHAPDKDASGVLLHLVGHMDGYPENHDNDAPAPDDDYLIASTGIVKALRVCLGNKEGGRFGSGHATPTASGTATPRQGVPGRPAEKKARDVSLELCESARKIRMRLRPAMIKEDREGNTQAYHRLVALDATLERIIQRFEDEYPEAKPRVELGRSPLGASPPDASSPPESPGLSRDGSLLDSGTRARGDSLDEGPDGTYGLGLSRTSSQPSLAARALTVEEGRMHRFGQSIRRQVLAPTGTDDYAHGTSVNDEPEAEHLVALRSKLAQLRGDEIRDRVLREGGDEVIRELGVDAEELKALKIEDPEQFEAFKNSHLAAEIAGNAANEENLLMMSNGKPGSNEERKETEAGGSLYSQVTA